MRPTQPASRILPESIGTANTPAEYRAFLTANPPQKYPSTCPATKEAWLPEPAPRTELRYSEQYGGYLVFFCGHQHGGVHFHKADACAHAEDLETYSFDDQNAWLAMFGYGVA